MFVMSDEDFLNLEHTVQTHEAERPDAGSLEYPAGLNPDFTSLFACC
jgi:hypothetical protein